MPRSKRWARCPSLEELVLPGNWVDLGWHCLDSLAEEHLEVQTTATAVQEKFWLPRVLGIYILVSLNFLMSSSTDIFAWGHELRTWECFALLSLASVCREFPGLSARTFLRTRDLEAWHNHGNVLFSAFWDSSGDEQREKLICIS